MTETTGIFLFALIGNVISAHSKSKEPHGVREGALCAAMVSSSIMRLVLHANACRPLLLLQTGREPASFEEAFASYLRVTFDRIACVLRRICEEGNRESASLGPC